MRKTLILFAGCCLIAATAKAQDSTGGDVASSQKAKAKASCQAAKTQPLTEAIANRYPWLTSAEFTDKVSELSNVPELWALITTLQKNIAKKGLYQDMQVQTGDNAGSTKDHPLPLTYLAGITADRKTDGSWVIAVYAEKAAPGSETKYGNIKDMALDGVAPVERIVVEGHNFTHEINGRILTGTF